MTRNDKIQSSDKTCHGKGMGMAAMGKVQEKH